MRTEQPTRRDSRRYAAAHAQRDASPNAKRVAYQSGTTVRTAQRWASPSECQGSPLEVFARYVATTDDPERLEVYANVTREQRRLEHLTNAELIAEIIELEAHDPRTEAEGNVARVTRGISPAERALIHERDATTDVKLAARWREAAARGLKESDVMDQWSPK